MDDKKKWEKPEMEVLAQGSPEEAVLGACKTDNVQGPGDAGAGRPFGCRQIVTLDSCDLLRQS